TIRRHSTPNLSPTLCSSDLLCILRYTCNQLLRDIYAVSMSHSLEVRVPYLDTVLVDMALSLPDSTKLNMDSSPAHEHDTYRSNGDRKSTRLNSSHEMI